MIPKEYQKSNLALELKAGKKRLEDALHDRNLAAGEFPEAAVQTSTGW
jgi:hypothetical protein